MVRPSFLKCLLMLTGIYYRRRIRRNGLQVVARRTTRTAAEAELEAGAGEAQI